MKQVAQKVKLQLLIRLNNIRKGFLTKFYAFLYVCHSDLYLNTKGRKVDDRESLIAGE